MSELIKNRETTSPISCYVEIKDVEEKEKTCAELKLFGYEATFSFSKNKHPILIVENNMWLTIRKSTLKESKELVYKNFINCRTDINLFLKLAELGKRPTISEAVSISEAVEAFKKCCTYRPWVDLCPVHGGERECDKCKHLQEFTKILNKQ